MQPADWLATPLGRRCLANEHRLVRRALQRVFGEVLLQIGGWGPANGFLRHARTQRAVLLDEPAGPRDRQGARGRSDAAPGSSVSSRLESLAVANDSVDVVLLPHTLERSETPHAVLREAARVLRPDGCLIALGFVPSGLWGLRHMLARGGYPAGSRHLIRERRLHDWLELLSFEVDRAIAYCHTLPFDEVRRFGVVPRESWSSRWLPMLAGAYLLVARKRSVNLTPIKPSWQRPRLQAVGGRVVPTARAAERPDEPLSQRAANS